MKRLTYAGKTASTWRCKHLYPILQKAHEATEEAKGKLPYDPTDDDLVRLGIEVMRKVEDAIRERYEESSYYTPGSDAGWYRYLNRLGLVRGLRWRTGLLLGMWKRLEADDTGAVHLNAWLKEVYEEAQEHLRAHATERLTEAPHAGL